jgi:phage FluMu protein Com
MAVSIFSCPECNATLKSAKAIAVGTKIKCPKCEAIFVIPVKNSAPTDEEEPRPVATGSATKKPTGPAQTKPAPKGARKPESKEEFAAYDDGEDDYRDEEDDRPRKLKKKKKKSKTNPNWILIGSISGLVVLILALGAIGAWVWPGFLLSAGDEPLAYVPANSTAIFRMEVEDLIDKTNSNAQFEQYLKQFPTSDATFNPADCEKETGMTIKELFHQLTIATNESFQTAAGGKPNPKVVVIIKSKHSFNRSKVAKFLKHSDEQKLKGKTVYKTKNGFTFFPTSNLIVAISNFSEQELEPILASKGKQPAPSGDIKAIADMVAQNPLWAVANLDSNTKQNLQGFLSFAPGLTEPDKNSLRSTINQAKCGGFWIAFENDQAKISAGVMCADSGGATQVKNELEKMWNSYTKGLLGGTLIKGLMSQVPAPFQPMIQQLIDSTAFSVQNNLAQVTTQISIQSLKSLQNLDPSLLMGAGGGGNFNRPGGMPRGLPAPGGTRPNNPNNPGGNRPRRPGG